MSAKRFNQACTLLQRLVRLRAADEGLMVTCPLCDKRVDYRDAHGAHFIPRDCKLHALDIRNLAATCYECNCLDPDHRFKMERYMARTHGQDFVDRLKATRHALCKYSRAQLEIIISGIKDQIRDEEVRLGLRSMS